MINLETEPRFKEMMKCLGFKKTSRSFIKSSKDIILEMMFGYATKGEKHVRYYSGSYFDNVSICIIITYRLNLITKIIIQMKMK